MILRWKPSFSASCIHAPACLLEGWPWANAQVAKTLQQSCEAFVSGIEASGLDACKALPLFTGLAAEYESNRQLVEIATLRLRGASTLSPAALERIARLLSDLKRVCLDAQPGLEGELELRIRPLREQWEARGPGLLSQITKLADHQFIVPTAEVVLVHPWVGGHGRTHPTLNRVTLEAVLANPRPEFPEPLRLGWLLSQLNLDLPRYADLFPGRRKRLVASMATLPLVLCAAQRVEWAELSETSLEQVMAFWTRPAGMPDDFARQLLNWWKTYESGKSSWPVALAALNQMLPKATSEANRG